MTDQTPVSSDEEVIAMSGVDNGPPEPEYVSEFLLSQSEIGDVMMLSVRQEVPDGWHVLDGSVLPAHEWPDFVEAMNIVERTFELPTPQRTPEEHFYIIKLGVHRPDPQELLSRVPDDSPLRMVVQKPPKSRWPKPNRDFMDLRNS